MGRQASFSTKQEYKFYFGIQSSADILQFGGQSQLSHSNQSKVRWLNSDLPQIVQRLQCLTQKSSDCIQSFLEMYTATLEGTQNLHWDFPQKFFPETSQTLTDAQIAEINLGLVIAHQLRQSPELVATYEI